jgi:hypothetical protein
VTAYVEIDGLSASEGAGQRVLGPIRVQSLLTVGESVTTALNAGDTTISIPTGATGIVLIPTSTGTANLKVRTSANAGDQGLPVSSQEPFVLIFASPAPTAIIINSNATQSALLTGWIW